MRVSWATELGLAERGNEDFVAAAAGAVVLLDGCGLPLGTELGCAHGTAWYARALGSRLLARMLDGLAGPPAAPPVGPPEGRYVPGGRPLVNRLAGAVADVAAAHRGTCDLRNPSTPAATVVALRVRGETLDYLVLGDSTLLLQHTTGRLAVVTTQVAPRYAAADPAVAQHAGTGSVPLRDLRRALLLSDGATRLVDVFGMLDWRELARLAEEYGPAALIERTREAERSDPRGERWPRGKIHDDATVAYCDFGAG